jgi:hypothetical protein
MPKVVLFLLVSLSLSGLANAKQDGRVNADKDRDGYLSYEEFLPMAPRIFKLIDMDRDNKISQAEFQTWVYQNDQSWLARQALEREKAAPPSNLGSKPAPPRKP